MRDDWIDYINYLQEQHEREECAAGGHKLVRDGLACYCFEIDNYPAALSEEE